MAAIAAANRPASQRPLQYLRPQVAVPDAGEAVRRLPHPEGGGPGLRHVPQRARTDPGQHRRELRPGCAGRHQRVPDDELEPWAGRSSGNAPNATLQILAPQEHYLDRRNELDLRVGKLLRAGRHRALVSIDFFNALNSNAVVNVNPGLQPGGDRRRAGVLLAADRDPERADDEVHRHV